MKSKYIVIDTFDAVEIPVVFSELMTHKDVAERLRGRKVHGAGVCYVADNEYHCFGRSESLNVDSRKEKDSDVLNRFLIG